MHVFAENVANTDKTTESKAASERDKFLDDLLIERGLNNFLELLDKASLKEPWHFGKRQIKKLDYEDGMLLTFMKLRQNFHYYHLGMDRRKHATLSLLQGSPYIQAHGFNNRCHKLLHKHQVAKHCKECFFHIIIQESSHRKSFSFYGSHGT
eukprot:Pgem_evm1s20055